MSRSGLLECRFAETHHNDKRDSGVAWTLLPRLSVG
jgi:hypothetical protein